jgi:hypothetical protein
MTRRMTVSLSWCASSAQPASGRVCTKRIASAFGEGRERAVPRVATGEAMRLDAVPEVDVDEGLETIHRQERLDGLVESESDDFAEQQGAQFQRGDPSSQAVPTGLDSECGATGHDDLNRVMVDERLQLRSPVAEVLNFIEEYVRGFAGVGGLVERSTENLALVPARDLEDRGVHRAKGRQLVQLDAEDAPRVYPALLQQKLNRLFLQRGLPDLPRPAKDDRGRNLGVQPAQDRAERPASMGGSTRPGSPCRHGLASRRSASTAGGQPSLVESLRPRIRRHLSHPTHRAAAQRHVVPPRQLGGDVASRTRERGISP